MVCCNMFCRRIARLNPYPTLVGSYAQCHWLGRVVISIGSGCGSRLLCFDGIIAGGPGNEIWDAMERAGTAAVSRGCCGCCCCRCCCSQHTESSPVDRYNTTKCADRSVNGHEYVIGFRSEFMCFLKLAEKNSL